MPEFHMAAVAAFYASPDGNAGECCLHLQHERKQKMLILCATAKSKSLTYYNE
jgi:hypothetical protein